MWADLGVKGCFGRDGRMGRAVGGSWSAGVCKSGRDAPLSLLACSLRRGPRARSCPR